MSVQQRVSRSHPDIDILSVTASRGKLPEADKGDDVEIEVCPSLLPGELLCGFAEVAERSSVVDEDRFCDDALSDRSETNKRKTLH